MDLLEKMNGDEHKDVTSPTFRSEIWIPILKRKL